MARDIRRFQRLAFRLERVVHAVFLTLFSALWKHFPREYTDSLAGSLLSDEPFHPISILLQNEERVDVFF